MAREREVRVKIVGEDRVSPAAKSAADGLGKLGPAGDRASGALGKVQGALDQFGGNLGKRVNSAIDGAVGALASIGPAATAATAGAGAAIVGLGALAAKGVQDFVRLAGEVRNFQRASGATAEESSKFVAVLDDMGISAETGASAIFKLAKNADSTKLASFGVEIEKNKDGTTNLTETLLNVADAYQSTNDPARRAELAFAAFGKQGQQLIPILEQGRSGLQGFFDAAEESGQIMSQEDIDKAREFELAMDDLGDAVSHLQRELGGGLVPAIANLASAGATGIEFVTDLTDKVGGMEKVIGLAGSAIPGVGTALGFFGGKSKEAGDKQKELEASTEAATISLSEEQAAAENAATALGTLLTAQSALIDTTLGLEGAQDRAEDSLNRYTEAEKAAAEAIRVHGANSVEGRAAAETLSDATLALKEAKVAEAKAAAEQIVQQLAANGVAVSAEQKTGLYKQRLGELAAQIGGPVGASLQQLADGITAVPDLKHIQVVLDASQAFAELAAFNQAMRASGNTTRQVSRGMEAEFTTRDSSGRAAKYRAAGGPVRPGEPYIVGEEGPEVVTFDRPGMVHPTPTGGRAAVGGGGITIVMPNYLGTLEDAMRQLESYVQRKARNGDPLWSALKG